MLQAIDIFGTKFQFNVKDKLSYKTNLGGVFSLLILAVFVLALWVFGRDIIERRNPFFITTEMTLDSTPVINITASDFFLAFRVNVENGDNIDDDRLLEYTYKYEYFAKNSTTLSLDFVSEKIVKMEKCNTSHIDNETLIAQNLGADNCVNIGTVTIGGNWDEESIGIISFNVNKCTSESEERNGIKCYSEEEINKFFNKSVWVEVKTLNKVVNPTIINNPLIKSYDFSNIPILPNTRKIKRFHYGISEVETDTGFVTQDLHITKFIELKSVASEFTYTDRGSLLTMEVPLTKNKKIYKRSYIKAHNIAAIVGGFMNIMFILFEAAFAFYGENHLRMFIYDELLDLRIETKEDRHSNKNIPLTSTSTQANVARPRENEIELSNLNKDNIDVIPFQNKKKVMEGEDKDHYEQGISETIHYKKKQKLNSKKRLSSISTFVNKERTKLELNKSTLFVFRYFYCCFTNSNKDENIYTNQIIFLAEHELAKRLDSIKLLKALDKQKVLNQIVLNENQCFILDNLRNKIITNNIKVEDYTKAIEEKIIHKERELEKYYKENRNDLSHIDEVLFELLHSDVAGRINTKMIVE